MAYTPEKKEKQREYNTTHKKKIGKAPELKANSMKKHNEAQTRYRNSMTPEQKQREREYNTAYKRAQREMLKQFQMQVSCEQAEELKISVQAQKEG